MEELRIGIIGAGNMGGAIARGLAKSKIIPEEKIQVSDISSENLQSLQNLYPKIKTFSSNQDLVANSDVIFLAVKPWILSSVASEIASKLDYKRQIIVSIAAGISLNELSTAFSPEASIFRLIPNTAIDVLESSSILSSSNTNAQQEQYIIHLLEALGKVFVVPESQLNALMSLSSCGIAYAFRYIRAACEGGVELGIHPERAKEVVLQTLRGAIEVLESGGTHPEAEIDKVTTPGGITIKGLNEMEANGFSNAVIKGLKASFIP